MIWVVIGALVILYVTVGYSALTFSYFMKRMPKWGEK